MRRILYVLRLASPFLTKRGRVTDLFVRSDTWSAAIFSVAASTGVDVDAWGNDPFFRVSSALPIFDDARGGRTVFFPVPDNLRNLMGRSGDRKVSKSVLYGDVDFFRSLGKGGVGILERGGLVMVNMAHGKVQDLGWVMTRTGLAVDRATGGPIEDMLFEVGDILVEPRLLLGLLVEVADDRVAEFDRYLTLLGLAGVGPSKSRGRGQFEICCSEDFLTPDLGKGAHLLLSLYYPTQDEVTAGVLDRSDYRLVQRSGYVTAPGAMVLRRNRVTMLSEGSVIRWTKPPSGAMVQVGELGPLGARPSRPIFRDGRAVSIEVGSDKEVSFGGAP